MLKKANGKTVYVGDPDALKLKAITIPQMFFASNAKGLTLAALLKATYSPSKNRDYFGTLGQLARMTWQDEKTVARHLVYWCDNKRMRGGAWLTKHGREHRRTATYSVAKHVRAAYDNLASDHHRFIAIPGIALEQLSTWNARLLFGWLARRWVLPNNCPDKFEGGYTTSEELSAMNCDYGISTFRITLTAKHLKISRQGFYNAMALIEERGLAQFYRPEDGGRTSFELHLPLPPGETLKAIERVRQP